VPFVRAIPLLAVPTAQHLWRSFVHAIPLLAVPTAQHLWRSFATNERQTSMEAEDLFSVV
jgi:hypothetical protein